MLLNELTEIPKINTRVWNSVKTRLGTVTEHLGNDRIRIVWDETGTQLDWWWKDIAFELESE